MIARNNMPLHEQVKEDILSKIHDATYKHGEKIPSERALSDHYGVSRVTIRNTINNLVHQGVLERRHGSGTFVRETPVESELERMTSGVEQMEKMGMKVEIEVLSAEYIEPDETMRETLEVPAGEMVYRIVRRMFADGLPILVTYIHTLAEVGRKLENVNMNKAAFLATLEDFGYQIQYAKEHIHATRATDFEKEMIGLDADTPVLGLERTVFVSQDKPLYLVRDVIHGDRYSLNVVLHRNR